MRQIRSRVRTGLVPDEGFADVGRVLPGADGVVAVVGSGLGAFAVALGRASSRVVVSVPGAQEAEAIVAAARPLLLGNVHVTSPARLSLEGPAEGFDLIVCQAAVLGPGGVRLLLREGGLSLVLMPGPLPMRLLRRRQGFSSRRSKGRDWKSARCAATGLRGRPLFPLPGADTPAIVIDEADWDDGFAFCMRHLYPANTLARRAAGRLAMVAPGRLLRSLAPDRWLLVSNVRMPDVVPTTIVGSATPDGEIKTVDWRAGTVTGRLRSTGEQARTEVLVAGWSAERWTMWPLLASARDRRRVRLLGALGPFLASSLRGARDPVVTRRCLTEARVGMTRISDLPEGATTWCRGLLGRVEMGARFPHTLEHGDMQLRNIVIRGNGTVEAIDRPYEPQPATAGSDVTRVIVDVLCRSAGDPGFDLAAAVQVATAADPALCRSLGRFAMTALGSSDPGLLADMMAFAVLRDARNGPVGGEAAFLTSASDGRLQALLQRAVAIT